MAKGFDDFLKAKEGWGALWYPDTLHHGLPPLWGGGLRDVHGDVGWKALSRAHILEE